MRIDHFAEWENEIELFCNKKNIDFNRIKKLSRCNGNDFLILYYSEYDGYEKDMLDDKPLPSVMLIKKEDDSLVIEMTKYAEQYLKRTDC